MALPREILEQIVEYVSTKDRYECATVCQAWYSPFIYLLYRCIYISTNKQVNEFYYALKENSHVGPLVRTISLGKEKILHFGTGIELKEVKAIKITQELLDMIDKRCPYIEELDFDQSQWVTLNSFPLHLLFRLKRLPTFNFKDLRVFMTKSTRTEGQSYNVFSHLNQLCIRGNTDIFKDLESFLQLLSYIPHLTTLVFESDNLQSKYKAPILTLEHLELIHTHLPSLQDLQFLNHFNFGISTFYLHHSDSIIAIIPSRPQLKCLTLEGTLQSYQWIQYISKAYPSLEHISLDLVHSPYSNPSIMEIVPMQYLNYKIKEAFQMIAERCHQLSFIRIRGLSTPLWLTPQFITIQSQKSRMTHMEVQFYGLDSDGVDRSVALITTTNHHRASSNVPDQQSLNLLSIRLPIWKNKMVNGHGQVTTATNWREIIRRLSIFNNLSHLELDAVSMAFTEGNQEDGFELDTLLEQFMNLKSIKLSGSSVQLSKSKRNKEDGVVVLQSSPLVLRLEELALHRIFFSSDIMDYLSAHCSNLKRLILYDCQQTALNTLSNRVETKITIHLNQLALDLIVLYQVRHPFQFAHSHTPGARFICLNNTIWSHIIEEAGTCKAISITNPEMINIVQRQHSYHELQHSIEDLSPSKAYYHTKDEWLDDLCFGYIDLHCQSAKRIFLDDCSIEQQEWTNNTSFHRKKKNV
ncbi:uncharacterized protein BX663DRAFT_512570 [Cokeromyces recurvatus]|uniref:uncharacterized protein n=1 Tax=Cokeromyces recurvatus TaxID=90255 RepID=UPI00221EBC4F|nr:uncharacterized protein BX663DRAFT_512570 [Cokeromyces recurvatus]KAI7901837.1 hypothetical protein BX663DRAFT_512570 [Cokeromyces recurvatus]